jgi:putative ATP-dependent endonuclease of OLD family
MHEQITNEPMLEPTVNSQTNGLDANGPRAAVKSNVGVLLVVEGPSDIQFLRRISRILHLDNVTIPDLNVLEETGRLIFVPFGGGCLHYWSHRLGPLAWPEFHLYDKETPPETGLCKQAARAVNGRVGCRAAITSKRSLENYLSPSAIEDAKGIRILFSDADSVADVASRACLPPHCQWDDLSHRAKRRLRNRSKKWLNTTAVDRMTPARLAQQDPVGELEGWLRTIGDLAIIGEVALHR